MANIVFLPVCSVCNAIIYDEVNYHRREPSMLGLFDNAVISPCKCPVCNNSFDKIVMPTKLPITTNQIVKALEEQRRKPK